MKVLLVNCPRGSEPADLVVLRRTTVERVAHELRALAGGGVPTKAERVVLRALANALYGTLVEQKQVALPAPVATPRPDPDSNPEQGGAP